MPKKSQKDKDSLDRDLESQEKESQLMRREQRMLNKMVTKVCFQNNIFEISLMPLRFSYSQSPFKSYKIY